MAGWRSTSSGSSPRSGSAGARQDPWGQSRWLRRSPVAEVGPRVWRLIDTGLRPAAQNFALNRALLEARRTGEAPSSLRFLRFTPSALLGFHQSAEQELNLDYCREQGITVQRRITGGGAIYFDPGQLGW